MVNKIRIVIGANFGDEGKGLMTNYFSHQATLRGESCLNVLHNGGAQRGHTVEYPNDKRHVFKHFGSGTFEGAHTYFSEDFILNPIIFRQEWEELKKMGVTPKVYVNPKCRVTTPYDMMLNQIIEESRGQNKHGSCGLGINETIVRHCSHLESFGTRIDDITSISKMIDKLNSIRKVYIHKKMLSEGIKEIDEKWMSIIDDDIICEHYLEDLAYMMENIKRSNNMILNNYDTIVFEGGQGLMLDMNNKEYFPHLTPSHTGMYNPIKTLKSVFNHSEVFKRLDIEACYVTRSYITRHGAGRLNRECRKEDISSIINDKTNIPNPNQGVLRYGKLDMDELYNRIFGDFKRNIDVEEYKNVNISFALTHLNEYEIQSCEKLKNSFSKLYHKLYYSYSPYEVII